MSTAAPRDLRNNYGDLLARASAGEHVDIVRDGVTIATLGPPRRPRGVSKARLAEAFRGAPRVDREAFFEDMYGEGPEALDDRLRDPFERSPDRSA